MYSLFNHGLAGRRRYTVADGRIILEIMGIRHLALVILIMHDHLSDYFLSLNRSDESPLGVNGGL